MQKSLVCLIDEAGSPKVTISNHSGSVFLLTFQLEHLISDLRALKTELSPRGKSGEYHACEDLLNTKSRIRALLCLHKELRMYIVERDKTKFSPDHIAFEKQAKIKKPPTGQL
ncbi:hypothetical protein BIY37_00810 [Candidatus Brocadia sapporoensis]|uniref:Uncharacterized protein n=1 Tax=Candidatus Brocadia sapporoensis TaxID=392547 RepID=A0A1V6M377_9BACT|nr:hypothetical protein [Candidatus Brocadia sapporoensis]MDG6005453.1 hypothetical protein [Candidatus Brocadia sp.]OQD46853.1 hypothetical protein BIY37_00810 [Candidatus Brocadia sapporoensis]GJQ22972.1 MAG: hypothetical protein HBSAPP01_07620 [Candidatus Brocadia sapporoensis]